MENKYWLLTAGKYDDRETLGVVVGGPVEALTIATRLTNERAADGTISRDMIHVEATGLVELS